MLPFLRMTKKFAILSALRKAMAHRCAHMYSREREARESGRSGPVKGQGGPVIGYSPLLSQDRKVSVTRISRDTAPAGLIRIPRIAYQRLLTSQRILAR